MQIKIDDLAGPEIARLLDGPLADRNSALPPESKHALDLGELHQPDITFWTRTGSPALYKIWG